MVVGGERRSPENKNSGRPGLGDRIRKDESGKAHSRGEEIMGETVEDTLCAPVCFLPLDKHHDQSSLVEEGFSSHLTVYSPL